MSKLVVPHGGGPLKSLIANKSDRPELAEKAENMAKVPMSSRELSDVLMLSMGAYTPLNGFMCEADWDGSCRNMKLSNGIFWPIPITLSTNTDLANSIQTGEQIALVNRETHLVHAIMTVIEKYRPDKDLECNQIFLTTDLDHPGVEKVMHQGDINLGGPIQVIDEGSMPDEFSDLYLRPNQARQIFDQNNWSKVAAFQTRNPMHRSHEHLVKIAAEVTDGVFIHQVLGKLKPGDIPARVRTKAIQTMIDHYFKPNTVIQAGYPIEMRYAGPREALFHALIRQNFGCSHLIVGRDHAGVGNYYGPFDAQNIFDRLWQGALLTQPLKIDMTFYCTKCYGMATDKTCPHNDEDRINISGTKQREMLSKGSPIPPEFSRPEVIEVLRSYYKSSK
ncbi:MAG: Sulfate adenylyltransferase [Alphaproteobacteria bacterium MarineAlpha3_Bin5]|nr:sulfate adenylyltransferase [Magnetovibrio sp.]PPR79405.1 MAG: Sulfate adenylyltransferase [Alphaproteobacteria bacterium MarineAlpha3_Bin5]